MKNKIILLLLLLFTISCEKKDEIIVKDIVGDEYNILSSKKEKLIIMTKSLICHDCMINLCDYLDTNINLKHYSYYTLCEDPQSIMGRRVIIETYKNVYSPKFNKVLFCDEDSTISKKLKIPTKLFEQAAPYIVFLDKNNNARYYSYSDIFKTGGLVKSDFDIEIKKHLDVCDLHIKR